MEELSKKARRREERRGLSVEQPVAKEEAPRHESNWIARAKQYYDAHYLRLFLIPIIIFVLALTQIGYQYVTTGNFIEQSVSLKGGVIFTLQHASADAMAIEQMLAEQFPQQDIEVRFLTQRGEQTGVIIEADLQQEQISALKAALEQELGTLPEDSYTIEFIGSTLGQSFFKQTLIALGLAFVFMSIVVFISFRVGAPSFFVILAVVADILETVAVFNLLGEKLGAAGIASFLMLIGYSIDTDVLLTTRVTKRREGSVTDAIFDGLATGLTMAGTSIIAVLIGLFMTDSEVLRQIFLIILVGLIFDVFNTWLKNAAILKWWLERRGKVRQHG